MAMPAGIDFERRYAMRRPTWGGAWLIFSLWLVAWMPLPTSAQDTSPYIPASADTVLQHVPPATDPRVRQFEALRQDAAHHPGDAARAVALAKAYVDYGRATGDARYLGRAIAVIDPFMKAVDPPVPVLLLHATVQQSRHAFAASRTELDQVLKRDPGNVQGWLTLATVAMVQGDFSTANKACVHLANTGGDFMGLVCSASLRSLDGHARQAYAMLTLVQDPGPKAPPAIHSWIEGLMADTAARMGDAAAADGHFRQALQFTPGDNFLLADYGEFLLGQGRPREALALVADDPTSDTSFLVRVTAKVMMNAPDAAKDIAQMDARFAAMDQRGDHVFLREEADFRRVAHQDANGALTLARENWKVQRASKDARAYLAAAIATGHPAAASEVIDFIRATGMSDPILDPLVQQATAAAVDSKAKRR
ncbi:hypothetical protein [Pinirhizobacter sp.]|jgi:cytochrome c-type biogenesis protein CcmH/NrfG|uniref:hypothetical protein n=1 Tax=Pinirhizobacter sp. TaxID=2950432 RepID=UPI002F41FADA